MLSPGCHDFEPAPPPADNEFAYRGRWRITLESATAAGGSSLDLHFGARRVYVVLGSARPRPPHAGAARRPPDPGIASPAPTSTAAWSTVSAQRLYDLVDLPRVEHHVLRLLPEAGVTGYSFTFG